MPGLATTWPVGGLCTQWLSEEIRIYPEGPGIHLPRRVRRRSRLALGRAKAGFAARRPLPAAGRPQTESGPPGGVSSPSRGVCRPGWEKRERRWCPGTPALGGSFREKPSLRPPPAVAVRAATNSLHARGLTDRSRITAGAGACHSRPPGGDPGAEPPPALWLHPPSRL